MPLAPIPRQKFAPLHDAFLAEMEEKGGEPFASFDHPFFVEDETRYKTRISVYALDALGLESWRKTQVGTGAILDAVQRACGPSVSRNLLEHKGRPEQRSYKALFLAAERGEQAGLKSQRNCSAPCILR